MIKTIITIAILLSVVVSITTASQIETINSQLFSKNSSLIDPYLLSTITIKSITTSSTLPIQQRDGISFDYNADNIIDGNFESAWVENVDGKGENETIIIDLDAPTTISEISLINGYAKTINSWSNNGRVIQFYLLFDGIEVAILNCKDEIKEQRFTLPKRVASIAVSQITLKIKSAKKGSKWSDTAVSEIVLYSSSSIVVIVLIIAIILFIVSLLYLKRKLKQRKLFTAYKLKQEIISKLEKVRKDIDSNFKEEITAYCKKTANENYTNHDLFFILKFAQYNKKLSSALNVDSLHEARLFRNKLAHPDDEYEISETAHIKRYVDIVDSEMKKLNRAIKSK